MQTEAEQPLYAKKQIEALQKSKTYWQKQVQKREGIFKEINEKAVELCDKRIDEIRLELGKEPLTRERQEVVENNDMTRFQRYKEWVRDNPVGLSVIAITIAGAVTTRAVIQIAAEAKS